MHYSFVSSAHVALPVVFVISLTHLSCPSSQSCHVLLLLDVLLVGILVRIRHLVFEDLDEVVKDDRKHGTHRRSNPCIQSDL